LEKQADVAKLRLAVDPARKSAYIIPSDYPGAVLDNKLDVCDDRSSGYPACKTADITPAVKAALKLYTDAMDFSTRQPSKQALVDVFGDGDEVIPAVELAIEDFSPISGLQCDIGHQHICAAPGHPLPILVSPDMSRVWRYCHQWQCFRIHRRHCRQ
jgi:hypothetical protein